MSGAAVIGAGPGLGLATALELGRQGHELHLVARSPERLAGLVEALGAADVSATGHVGDVTDHAGLTALVRDIDACSPLEVCVFQPGIESAHLVDILDLTVDSFRPDLELLPLGATAVAEALLPAMTSRGSGSFVMVGGGASRLTLRAFGNHGPAAAALRTFALTLAGALGGTGVHAAFLAVAGMIGASGVHGIDAERIAERIARLARERDVRELVVTPDGEIEPKGAR